MILEILQYPHETLNQKSTPVRKITKDLQEFGKDLIETLDVANGLGLAANQVGRTVRVLAMKYKTKTIVLYNPIVVSKSKIRRPSKEGCLSFDYECIIKRHVSCKVKYLDINNKQKYIEFEGLDAIVFQHELNHLDGLTFADIDDKIIIEEGK